MSFIDGNGKYHKDGDEPMGHDVNSQWKAANHEMQRKVFNGDIQQPFIAGEVNREFVEVYRGEVADSYFTQEQIDAADRKLS
jgi:hypothetical protein